MDKSPPQAQASTPSGNRCHLTRSVRAFTLIEILIATAVFAILVAMMASVANQSFSVWSKSGNKSDLRESARMAVQFIGSELRQAVLPVYPGDQDGLQFVINPSSISTSSTSSKNRDCIFWQAPIATSGSSGNLAIVGYFVRNQQLCRLLVNPDDPDYSIYTQRDWCTEDLLSKKAPATAQADFKGLFLENVLGMWATAYVTGTASATGTATSQYDSRVEKKLPSRVEISLALLDKPGAQLLKRGATLPDVNTYSDAASFQNALPANLQGHVETATISVSFSPQ